MASEPLDLRGAAGCEAEAVRLIETALDRFGVEGIALSFNGGKDCTAVLHLLRAVLAMRGAPLSDVVAVYFRQDDPPELAEFMEDCRRTFGLRILTMDCGPKAGLEELLRTHPKIKAVLMGQRRDDPHGKALQPIQSTDVHKGWPAVLRVNPILNWRYRDVWKFLREHQLAYCKLYDKGYTSIGAAAASSPNLALQTQNPEAFLPAYLLDDDRKERAGRDDPHHPHPPRENHLQ